MELSNDKSYLSEQIIQLLEKLDYPQLVRMGDISWQKFNKEWANEAIQQKAVHVIGGFEYNTRYVPLETVVTLVLACVSFTILMLKCFK